MPQPSCLDLVESQAACRIGLAAWDRLHLHVAGTRLVLERQVDAVVELRSLAQKVPPTRSLVDELIDERRRSATE